MKSTIVIPIITFWAFMFVDIQAQPAYDLSVLQREYLGRGLTIYGTSDDSVMVSWRFLRSDAPSQTFTLQLNGRNVFKRALFSATSAKIQKKLLKSMGDNIFEITSSSGEKFSKTVQGVPMDYLSIPLQQPEGGTCPDGQRYGYTANDATVADVDGDGEYEIILKWEPTNAHDNSHDGYTGPVLIDCYTLCGKHLWRINLGRNIRAGAHYTQLLVYDFDGDNKAEVVLRTADGTVDGQGNSIGNDTIDYRYNGFISKQIDGKMTPHNTHIKGRVLNGPEYLTVFDGLTGRALSSVPFVPQRGDVSAWGDSYGNRSDRFLACVAYLDGIHPSIVECRGYYTRTVIAAWLWNGTEISQQWVFDTDTPQWNHYSGQGNHNLRVADVDADGCDEITYGSMAIDHNGEGLYNTRMGHGDAIHLFPFLPDSHKLQVWDVHENRRDGSELREAATGEVLFQIKSNEDVGRGLAADIDPTSPGAEMWSSSSGGLRNIRGELLDSKTRIPINFAIWWDADTLRELLDHERIYKYDWRERCCRVLADFSQDCTFNNGSKSNPCLSADILGDWREEVLVRTRDNKELRIYLTPHSTYTRHVCLMEDIPYRLSVAYQNVGYNQPPELGVKISEQ